MARGHCVPPHRRPGGPHAPDRPPSAAWGRAWFARSGTMAVSSPGNASCRQRHRQRAIFGLWGGGDVHLGRPADERLQRRVALRPVTQHRRPRRRLSTDARAHRRRRTWFCRSRCAPTCASGRTPRPRRCCRCSARRRSGRRCCRRPRPFHRVLWSARGTQHECPGHSWISLFWIYCVNIL